MKVTEQILSQLPLLRLVNRRTLEHVGPCPFCGGNGRRSDRFHIWLQPGRERYWCRACDAKGRLDKPLSEGQTQRYARVATRQGHKVCLPEPQLAHHTFYRELYTILALWAHSLLLDECNPEPLAYLRQRGLNDATISRNLLGVTLRDPTALVAVLHRDAPGLLPYAEEAGVLVRGHTGELRTHPNLCGCLVFPYIANGQVVDLRTRTFPGKGYRSLPGNYAERGAVFPLGWEELDHCNTVIITEGEIKALAVSQAYHAGLLDAPALAHPGLSYFREEWPTLLQEKGVHTVVLAYDSQPRPVKDGTLALAPEEIWSLRHGQRLVDAGLNVRVLRLPLERGEEKGDLDAFLCSRPAHQLQHLLDVAPSLHDYQRSLPRALLCAAKLGQPGSYPLRRSRPQLLKEVPSSEATKSASEARSLTDARSEIETLVRDHAVRGEGFVVLAHPPGAGKGHNTAAGLQAYLRTHPSPGTIVWTGLRKEQIHDQESIALTPLHGRNSSNCHKIGEAQALAARGYSVRLALCQRRCPFVGSCRYLAQFNQEADFFAPQDLLQATGWWENAKVLVLDEFDPSRLISIVTLDSVNIARMSTATSCPHARTLLRWLGIVLSSDTDRTVSGTLLLSELNALARAEGLNLGQTLRAANKALPPDDDVHQLAGLPHGATQADYAALPPNYLATIVRLLDEEHRKQLAAIPFTGRLETSGGRLMLYLRRDHLIAQLARRDQPKLILDATANEGLLRAIFPNTPLRLERPTITGAAQVIQVISRDWAKSTLYGERRTRWYDEVAAQIRPSRPTLVVCTQACEADLRAALVERGHEGVVVAHYGAIRGSNAYKGYDVVLAQIYHPNLDAVIREGRALFAGEGAPLDERMVTNDRVVEDATGARWVVEVPTFADERLAALLSHHREAELVQAALRGRPLDHPETQITLLFGLPLENLPPTEIRTGTVSLTSNDGRYEHARDKLVSAAKQLLAESRRVVSVEDLVDVTKQSSVTVRKHLPQVAKRLGLRLMQQRRVVALPRGGKRTYQRTALLQRGRRVPLPYERVKRVDINKPEQLESNDQARNLNIHTRLIYGPMPPDSREKRGFGRAYIVTYRLKKRKGGICSGPEPSTHPQYNE